MTEGSDGLLSCAPEVRRRRGRLRCILLDGCQLLVDSRSGAGELVGDLDLKGCADRVGDLSLVHGRELLLHRALDEQLTFAAESPPRFEQQGDGQTPERPDDERRNDTGQGARLLRESESDTGEDCAGDGEGDGDGRMGQPPRQRYRLRLSISEHRAVHEEDPESRYEGADQPDEDPGPDLLPRPRTTDDQGGHREQHGDHECLPGDRPPTTDSITEGRLPWQLSHGSPSGLPNRRTRGR